MTMSNEEENSQEEAGEEFPGLRFRPTEQELLGYYLKRKSTGKLPSNPYIRVVDVYRYDPWELYQSQEKDEEMYMFVGKSETQRRVSRVTRSGAWKCLGSEKRIWDSRKKLLLGHKKSLRFYVGKASERQKTEWFMTEFLLPFSEPQNYVLCKLYKISSTYQEKVKCAEASIGSVSAVEIRESGVSEVNSYSCMKGIPSSSTAASLAQSVCGEMAEISSSRVVHDHGKDLWQDWEQLFDWASSPAPGYEGGEQLFSFASAPSPGYEDGKQLFSFASAPSPGYEDGKQLFSFASAPSSPSPVYEDGKQLFSFASAPSSPSPGYEDGKQLFTFASAPSSPSPGYEDGEQLFSFASAPSPGYEDGKQLFSFASAPSSPSPEYEDGKQLFSFASAPALAPGSVSSGCPHPSSVSSGCPAPSSVSSGWPALACDSPSAPNSFPKK